MKELKNYPLYEVTPVHSVRELLAMAEEEAGDKLAFRYRTDGDNIRDVTYREFIRDVRALGSALTERGLIGDHIAQSGENSYRWINVYLTVLRGDGVYVPVDKDLPAPTSSTSSPTAIPPCCSTRRSTTTSCSRTPTAPSPASSSSSGW